MTDEGEKELCGEQKRRDLEAQFDHALDEVPKGERGDLKKGFAARLEAGGVRSVNWFVETVHDQPPLVCRGPEMARWFISYRIDLLSNVSALASAGGSCRPERNACNEQPIWTELSGSDAARA